MVGISLAVLLLGAFYLKLLIWVCFKTRFPYEYWDIAIPLLSIFIAWINYKKLQRATPRYVANDFGRYYIYAGLLFSVSGLLVTQYAFYLLGFTITMYGLIYYYSGKKIADYFIFPLGLLLFKLPWGEYLINSLGTANLNQLQAKLVAAMATLCGTPSIADSIFVKHRSFITEISDRCSGWFSIDAKVFLGVLFIYFSGLTNMQKWLRGISLLPAIMFINFIRIFILHMTWVYFTPQFTTDAIHTWVNHGHKLVLIIFFFIISSTKKAIFVQK